MRMRVVIVTMDDHLTGAVERAAARLSREIPGVSLRLHSAADWGSHPEALARCLKDIAEGDIILATMLFLDEQIQAVLPALEARRESCDALVSIVSAAEVTKLTRMGKYRMGGPDGGLVGMLKKLRGKPQPGGNAGARQMKMLRRIPQFLRFIPGTAQDVRAYFLACNTGWRGRKTMSSISSVS